MEKERNGSSILLVLGILSLVAMLGLGMARSFISKKRENSRSSHADEIPDWVDAQCW